MSEESQQNVLKTPDSRERAGIEIFICDASAEAGRLLTALQSKGYSIVDVPLGLLPSRVLYEIPRLVICDADAREARAHLAEMVKNANVPLAILLVGHEDGALAHDPGLALLAKDTMTRPLEIAQALAQISLMVGPASRDQGVHHRVGRAGRAPILVASARKPYRSDSTSQMPLGRASILPDDDRVRLSPAPRRSRPEELGKPDEERSSLAASPIPSNGPPSSERVQLSAATETLLSEGRKRAVAYPHQTARPSRLSLSHPSSSAEVREEFVEALQEALALGLSELDDGEDRSTSAGTDLPRRPSKPASFAPPSVLGPDELTNAGGRLDLAPLRRGPGTPLPLDDLSDLLKGTAPGFEVPGVITPDRLSSAGEGASERDNLAATVPPPLRRERRDSSLTGTGIKPGVVLPDPVDYERSPTDAPPPPTSRSSPPLRQMEESTSATPESQTWVPISALEGLARAVRERKSGALAQQEGPGIRRIVFVDGDISTVASSIKTESLAHFLHERGDFTGEVLDSLSALPQFGRHAGAALIARGLLAQDDLWPVLRAHAEWILGRSILSRAPTHLETVVPGRVLEEPAVFGGAAGTEIYIDAVRRVISPDEALSLLGGGERVIGLGSRESLLAESALTPDEQEAVYEMAEQPLAPFLYSRPELVPVLLALCQLQIFSTGGELRPLSKSPRVSERSRELDDGAFEARVRSRRALVDDGDYFSILGVTRSATAYEIDRARDELLAEYADEKLNSRTIHLTSDLSLLRDTIDEAHLVLSDEVRRSRYRAALEALPS